MDSEFLKNLLLCPDCQHPLFIERQVTRCNCCQFTSTLDCLLPQNPIERTVRVTPRSNLNESLDDVVFGRPTITYKGPMPPRQAVDVLSILQDNRRTGQDILLDVGCGCGEFAEPLGRLGFRYVGIDVGARPPQIQADAHSIPFKDGAFDAAFSVAVLEHLYNPQLAVSEIRRVLRPNCVFVGTTAFGEPFHNSYFHASPWGIYTWLTSAGFKVERLWVCRDTLSALAEMGGYPRILRPAIHLVSRLSRVGVLAPRRWLYGDGNIVSSLVTAGSIGFVARSIDN